MTPPVPGQSRIFGARCGGARPFSDGRHSSSRGAVRTRGRRRRRRGAASLVGSSDAGHLSCVHTPNQRPLLELKQRLKMFTICLEKLNRLLWMVF